MRVGLEDGWDVGLNNRRWNVSQLEIVDVERHQGRLIAGGRLKIQKCPLSALIVIGRHEVLRDIRLVPLSVARNGNGGDSRIAHVAQERGLKTHVDGVLLAFTRLNLHPYADRLLRAGIHSVTYADLGAVPGGDAVGGQKAVRAVV